MAGDKRHVVKLEYSVIDQNNVETLGANIRIGHVKTEHLPIYNEVIDRKINEAKAELAKKEAEGAFA
jgi:hypothetical protein